MLEESWKPNEVLKLYNVPSNFLHFHEFGAISCTVAKISMFNMLI